MNRHFSGAYGTAFLLRCHVHLGQPWNADPVARGFFYSVYIIADYTTRVNATTLSWREEQRLVKAFPLPILSLRFSVQFHVIQSYRIPTTH